MPCEILTNPLDCNPSDIVDGVVGNVASSAWEAVCKSFADAAVAMLKSFAGAFAAFPNVDLTSDGVRSVYGLSLGIAAVVAAVLLFVQIGRTVLTQDGSGLAQAFIGLGKSALAFLVTLTVASTALVAADALTVFIIARSFGNAEGLTAKLTTVFSLSNGPVVNSPALLLLLAVVGIVIVAVLWFELLLRNAAVVVLVATSPIAAVGMVSDATKAWWSQTVSATIRLIILKPVIALVFAVGFGVFGNETEDIGAVLAGMLILLLAALSWPAIGRFFTFAAAHTGGGSGLAGVIGFGAGRAADTVGAGAPAGVEPDEFGRHAEARTMAKFANRGTGTGPSAGSTAAVGGGGSTGGAAGGSGAAAAGAGAGAGVPLVVAKGAEMAQRAVNSLMGRMEQTAGHAGLPGASPHAHPAGYARPIPWITSSSQSRPATGDGQGGDPATQPGGTPPAGPAPADPLQSRPAPVEPMSTATPPLESGLVSPVDEREAPPAVTGLPSLPPVVDTGTPPEPAGAGSSAGIPSPRPASPVEHNGPAEPVRPAEPVKPVPGGAQRVGPVEHVRRPMQGGPVEHLKKGDKS